MLGTDGAWTTTMGLSGREWQKVTRTSTNARSSLRRDRCEAAPVRRKGASAAGDGAHRVDADDDRGHGIERQLVADVASSEELTEEVALALRQAHEHTTSLEVDRRHLV